MTCLHQVSVKAGADISSLTSNQTERGGGEDDDAEVEQMLQTQCSKGRKLPTHFKGGSGDRSHSHIDNVIFQTRICVEVNCIKWMQTF